MLSIYCQGPDSYWARRCGAGEVCDFAGKQTIDGSSPSESKLGGCTSHPHRHKVDQPAFELSFTEADDATSERSRLYGWALAGAGLGAITGWSAGCGPAAPASRVAAAAGWVAATRLCGVR